MLLDRAVAAGRSTPCLSATHLPPSQSCRLEMTDAEDAEAYRRWKQGIPLLYDWFVSHHLVWPSLTCRRAPACQRLRAARG